MYSQTEPTTPPRTPRKNNQDIPQQYTKSNIPQESGSRQKPRHKNHPRHVNISPATGGTDRRTPPPSTAAGISSSAKAVNTPSAAAYAGPTFHASPAPSALPIPSFYSKSVPESPGGKEGRGSSASSNNEALMSRANIRSVEFDREDSPLDFFFKADREEKARARSASSTQETVTATGPFQPPLSPNSSHTPPVGPAHSNHRFSHASRSNSNGIFPFEMDSQNTPGPPYGPAFTTPYSERIKAARNASSHSSFPTESAHKPTGSLDKAEQLKAYLFSESPPASATCSVPSSTNLSGVQAYIPSSNEAKTPVYPLRQNARSSGLRQEVTPSKTPIKLPEQGNPFVGSPISSRLTRDGPSAYPTSARPPTAANTERTTELRGMEDSLRKLLKLDLVKD